MNAFRLRVPRAGAGELDQVIADLEAAPLSPPFAEERIRCMAAFAKSLGRRSAAHPEIRALAFWLRRAELERMAKRFAAALPTGSIRQPRGIVFHVPPSNVDTMFAYSWAISMLLGNANIVRLSARTQGQGDLIIDVLNETLADHPEIAQGNVMVEYGHDDKISARLSAVCSTRVVWGGDSTIATFRRWPLAPHATEVNFADRTSLAVLDSRRYAELAEVNRDSLATRFVNDNYFFDQMGCSSARLVAWIGADIDEDVQADFYARVGTAARAKGYLADASVSIAKLGQAYRSAIDMDAKRLKQSSPEVTVLEMDRSVVAPEDFVGGGFFFQVEIGSLSDLAPIITRRHQTMAVFGVDQADAEQFVRDLRGRGIDRIVPIGGALSFDHAWDGMDLFVEFTRQVTVATGQRGVSSP